MSIYFDKINENTLYDIPRLVSIVSDECFG